MHMYPYERNRSQWFMKSTGMLDGNKTLLPLLIPTYLPTVTITIYLTLPICVVLSVTVSIQKGIFGLEDSVVVVVGLYNGFHDNG
jgi:ABC-type transporter Mla maintaining outer membrane lipid asymmetry permease subunit MlaE